MENSYTVEGSVCEKCGGTTRYKLDGRCVPCRKATRRARFQVPGVKEKRNASKQGYRRSPKGIEYYLRKTYGMSLAEYQDRLLKQDYKCAICKATLHALKGQIQAQSVCNVDHDHATGAVRGLLCHHCNNGLGQFFDNPSLLRGAAVYLEGTL